MEEINSNKAGLALGILFAAIHALWAAAVGLGLGQAFLDIGHSMHFVEMTATITALSITNALAGIVLAFATGYAIGFAFAYIWNQIK